MRRRHAAAGVTLLLVAGTVLAILLTPGGATPQAPLEQPVAETPASPEPSAETNATSKAAPDQSVTETPATSAAAPAVPPAAAETDATPEVTPEQSIAETSAPPDPPLTQSDATPGVTPEQPIAETSVPPEPPVLSYTRLDLTGQATIPGSYAFLDPTGHAVTTYEGLRDGTATALLIHTHDAHGVSQAALYDAVTPGDLVEWRQAGDCFVRYQVTAVQPDPTGTVPQKLLAVAWMTYAFAGCTGAVANTSVTTLDWAELPDLGGTSLTTPVVHGTLQVVPEGWTGAIDPGREAYALPAGAPPYPGPYAETDDVTVARGYPYWREPALPAGWTFRYAFTGGLDVNYGYCAFYDAADGFLNVRICGEALLGLGTRRMAASWLTDGGSYGMRAGARETRWISGRPAVVQYSPEGPNHYPVSSVRVWVHDVATQSIYTVIGEDPSLLGSNAEGVIAIARSLFEHPPPLLYDTYDRSGAVAEPGHYAFLEDPDDTSTAVTTYEGLRDGSTTALLVHQADAYGASQAALYDAVEPGDLFEWRQADDCFVRYQVAEVKPDPAGTVPRTLLAVAWMTYAFAGCTGTIATTTAATLDWSALPDLGGTSLATPIRHGLYQLAPEGWTGTTEPVEVREPPGGFPDTYPVPGIETTDLAVARAFPYWREPALPAGWTFRYAERGGFRVSSYDGHCAYYVNARGFRGVEICGDYAVNRYGPTEASWLARGGPGERRQGVYETRVIAGRPALVDYSPLGPHHHRSGAIHVWVYDPATESDYYIRSRDRTLRGANVEAVSAIARSLFESASPP